MSQVAIILDVPQQATAVSEVGPILAIAEDAARQVRNQFPAERPQKLSWQFTFSTTTTDSDPGAAALRFNSATPAARGVEDHASNPAQVTRIYVDDAPTATGSLTVASFLNDIVDVIPNSVKARLTIYKTSDPTNFARFDVTDVIDATGYTKVVVSLKSWNGLSTEADTSLIFANSTAVTVEIEPVGAQRQNSASLDSVVSADTDLSALTTAEIATEVAAGVVTALAAVEFIAVAGAVAGDVTGVTGIATTDVLVSVYKVVEAAPPTVEDLTAEFTISAADTINNDAGTSSDSETLLVEWYTPI